MIPMNGLIPHLCPEISRGFFTYNEYRYYLETLKTLYTNRTGESK